MKDRVQRIAVILAVGLAIAILYEGVRKHFHQRNFRMTFGIEAPKTQMERVEARRVVQRQLSEMFHQAMQSTELGNPQSLGATKAALDRWIVAEDLAKNEKLRRVDEIDEALERVDRTIKETQDFLRTVPRESGIEILRRFQKKT
jgi:hypothetical protein